MTAAERTKIRALLVAVAAIHGTDDDGPEHDRHCQSMLTDGEPERPCDCGAVELRKAQQAVEKMMRRGRRP